MSYIIYLRGQLVNNLLTWKFHLEGTNLIKNDLANI